MKFMHYSKLSNATQPATHLKARRARVILGQYVHLSPGGKYFVSEQAEVVVGNKALLGRDHRIEASSHSKIHIGSNVHFHENVRIQAINGAHTTIGDGCFFDHDVSILSHTSITIGHGCLFAAFSYLSDHNHKTDKSTPIQNQGYDTEPIAIGNDVWLGVGATLIKGANLGHGVVVAARSVVNKTVPDYEIWGGIPAKKLGERK